MWTLQYPLDLTVFKPPPPLNRTPLSRADTLQVGNEKISGPIRYYFDMDDTGHTTIVSAISVCSSLISLINFLQLTFASCSVTKISFFAVLFIVYAGSVME